MKKKLVMSISIFVILGVVLFPVALGVGKQDETQISNDNIVAKIIFTWPQRILASGENCSIVLSESGKPYYWSYNSYKDGDYIRPVGPSELLTINIEDCISVDAYRDLFVLTTAKGDIYQLKYDVVSNSFYSIKKVNGIGKAKYAVVNWDYEYYYDNVYNYLTYDYTVYGYALTENGFVYRWKADDGDLLAKKINLEDKVSLLMFGYAILKNNKIVDLNSGNYIQSSEESEDIVEILRPRFGISIMLSRKGVFYRLDFEEGTMEEMPNKDFVIYLNEYNNDYIVNAGIRYDGEILDREGNTPFDIHNGIYMNGGTILTADGFIYQVLDTFYLKHWTDSEDELLVYEYNAVKISIPESLPTTYLIETLTNNINPQYSYIDAWGDVKNWTYLGQ